MLPTILAVPFVVGLRLRLGRHIAGGKRAPRASGMDVPHGNADLRRKGDRRKEDGLHHDAWRGREQEDRLAGTYFAGLCERMLATIDNSMSRTSFSDWLENRSDQAPNADNLAFVMARAGAAGVSSDDLAKAVGIPPESFRDILRALVATGQVRVLKVNGEMVYRAAT
jgi:hypothetical protein